MARLVLNPDSPTPRELQLKPGVNRLGRSEDNDFSIPDPSVSGAHCVILVNDDSVRIKDLGSTNGTYVNRAAVMEAVLRPGQTILLGRAALLFQAERPAAAIAARPAAAPPPSAKAPTPAPVRVVPVGKPATPPQATAVAPTSPPPRPIPAAPRVPTARPVGVAAPAPVAFAAPAPVAVALAAPVAVEAPAPVAVAVPPPFPGQPAVPGGPHQCKSHPKSPARYFCAHCQQFFCELCVASRPVGGAFHKFCRHCGAECAPLQVQLMGQAPVKGFFSRLPGAFVYPFRGSGVLMIIVAAILFVAARRVVGLFSIVLSIVLFGYLFSFMQNIVHATAAGDDEMPDLPGFDDVFGGALRLAGTTIISFAIPLVLLVLNTFAGMDIPPVYILATVVLGGFYFPMAFLAVAMMDSLAAANPLVVVTAVLKVPLAYFVTALLTVGIYFARWVGDFVFAIIQRQAIVTKSTQEMLLMFGLRIVWSLFSIYLLVVSMRLLGILYVTNKQKLGWFKR